MNLRLKINLSTLLPLLIGVLIVVGIATIPIYFVYPVMIDELIDDMTDDQQVVLQSISKQQAYAVNNLVYPGVQYTLLFGDLLEKYYSKQLIVKDSFTGAGCSVNLVLLTLGLDVPDDIDPMTNQSASRTMWYDGNYNTTAAQLDAVSQQHLYDSDVMHFIMMPFRILGNLSEIYMAFERDGLFSYAPAEPRAAYFDYSLPNCTYLEGPTSYYEPRCRGWYIRTKSNPLLDAATITDPYIFAGQNYLGINICRALWQEDGLKMEECVGYSIKKVTDFMDELKSKSTYNYILNLDLKVVQHPDLNITDLYNEITIQSLEFTDNDQAEIEDFNSNVLPLFKDGEEHLIKYQKNDEKL